MFIASAIIRRKLVESNAHTTRDEAARELFTKFPKLRSCNTAVAVMQVGTWKTFGRDIQSYSRFDLPRAKITKAQALQMIRDLYRELNTADHETKADWMTHDLAGDRGCALLDTMLTSKAFSDEDRAKFYDTL